MSKSQNFTTISEQIDILKQRGLQFDNESFSGKLLECYGYYNIINGYKDPYIIKSEDGEEKYIDGVTFERIFSLFQLDHAIRNNLMIVMLDLEEQLRSVTSYVIGESFGSNINDYLKFSNYQNRSKTPERFSLPSILDSLKNTSRSNKNPIKYHRDTYGNVPPWVLFKGVYLSTLVNFIKLQKPAQKISIVSFMYPYEKDLVNEHLTNIFIDTLFLCLEYRNLAAHGGRVYNYNPTSKIRNSPESELVLSSTITNYNLIHKTYALGTLLCMLDLFKKPDGSQSLHDCIEKEIHRHHSKYPDDYDYIVNSIGISDIYSL